MSKKDKKDIEEEHVETSETQTAEVEEQVIEEKTVEDKLKAEVKHEKDKFLRLFAEFENYKKRTSRRAY